MKAENSSLDSQGGKRCRYSGRSTSASEQLCVCVPPGGYTATRGSRGNCLNWKSWAQTDVVLLTPCGQNQIRLWLDCLIKAKFTAYGKGLNCWTFLGVAKLDPAAKDWFLQVYCKFEGINSIYVYLYDSDTFLPESNNRTSIAHNIKKNNNKNRFTNWLHTA